MNLICEWNSRQIEEEPLPQQLSKLRTHILDPATIDAKALTRSTISGKTHPQCDMINVIF